MNLKNGRLTILCSDESVVIEVYDRDSGVQFLEMEIEPMHFTAALGRLSRVPVSNVNLHGLNLLGRKKESRPFEFVVGHTKEVGYGEERKELAKKIAKEKAPKGWEPDLYFGSHDSFFYKGINLWARTTLKRWVLIKN